MYSFKNYYLFGVLTSENQMPSLSFCNTSLDTPEIFLIWPSARLALQWDDNWIAGTLCLLSIVYIARAMN